METAINYALFAILGLCVGSFCNVVIYRLPIMLMLMQEPAQESPSTSRPCKTAHSLHSLNVFSPRSHCPQCQHFIPFYLNIPLFSYLLLRGKCRYCRAPISWQYPAVELVCGGATLLAVYLCGIGWQLAAILPMTWALIALIFIDCEHQLLPDDITLPLLWLGLLSNALGIFSFTTLENVVVGAAVGYGSLWLLAALFKAVRKQDGMGHGDFKLFAVFGAWFGWQMLPIILLLASLAGSIVGIAVIVCSHDKNKKNFSSPLPFGPYLATSGWLMLFIGASIKQFMMQHLLLLH